MTTLIVIRHGQSEGNAAGIFTGSTNAPLTELGRHQAELVCDYLKDYKIDKVYSSTLDRAYETALPIAEARGLTVERREGIREINGGLWETMEYDHIRAKYGDAYNLWLTDMGNAVCSEGESVAQLTERVKEEICRIVAENEGKTVAVVCHGTPIRALACIWQGVDICDMQSVDWVPNASVSIVEYEKADSSPNVILYGYKDHLKDCLTNLPKTV